MLDRVVSGGQTGVDRAALDAAMACGIAVGGWCPRGRRADDGCIPGRYPLRETPSHAYRERTSWNVRDSDATLVLNLGELEGGTRYTTEVAARLGRPFIVVDLAKGDAAEHASRFLDDHRVAVLNVAGPRESRHPGIHERAYRVLVEVFRGDDGAAALVLREPPKGGADSAEA